MLRYRQTHVPRKHMGLLYPELLEEVKHQKTVTFKIAAARCVTTGSSDTRNCHTTGGSIRWNWLPAPNPFCFTSLTSSSLAKSLQRESGKHYIYKTRPRCYEKETVRKLLEIDEWDSLKKKYENKTKRDGKEKRQSHSVLETLNWLRGTPGI